MTLKPYRILVLTLLATLAVALPASAQYTPPGTSQAWAGYNADFLSTDSSGNHFFANAQGGTTAAGFWEEANEIAMADDGYNWAVLNDTANLPLYVAEINSLCAGFTDAHGHDWSSDAFNDDMNWATIAFARAYAITGTASQLADAITNYNTVWTRAQSPAGSGNGLAGLIQIQPPHVANLDSPVNFTFVIAGNLLTTLTGVATYKAEADNVYTWSMANLYQPTVNTGLCTGHPTLTCGKVYDGNSVSVGGATGPTDYTYDYGIAMEAMVMEGNGTIAQTVANWLMYNFSGVTYPYVGTWTINGTAYNVLPNYLQGAMNDSGYDGIAIRGISYGLSQGVFNASTLAWAQANASAVWSIRNASGVSWNNWLTQTPATGLYSWDDSASMAALFLVPSSSVAVTAPSTDPTKPTILTATVTPITTTAATGSVQFYANGKAIGSRSTLANNIATLTYTFGSAGSNTVTATYFGDSNYTASLSQPITLTLLTPAFTLTSSPASFTLAAGGTATSTISVASSAGFAGTVGLTCSPSIPAASCSIAPAAVTLAAGGTATATLTLNSATGIIGALNATITGTSGSLTASTSVAGTVVNPTFTLAITPTTLSFTSGATSGNSTVATVTSVNYFASSVTITCSLSSGSAAFQPSCTPSPTTVTPAANGMVSSTITVGSTTAQTSLQMPAWPAIPVATLAFTFLWPIGRRKRFSVVAAIVLACTLTALSGCGGKSSSSSSTSTSPHSSAGSYTLTITATSGAITQSVTIPVTIN